MVRRLTETIIQLDFTFYSTVLGTPPFLAPVNFVYTFSKKFVEFVGTIRVVADISPCDAADSKFPVEHV